jgi:hypothetical protein
MRVEGYLFVPHRGQYRFSFPVNEERGQIKAGLIAESSRHWDYLWDATMRGRPTLHELTSEDYSAMRSEFTVPILKAFDQEKFRVKHVRNSPLRHALQNSAWVEFANVTP